MSIIKPIAQLLGYILDILFMGLNAIGIGNIAIAIIIFTLLVKMLMLPLQIKQQKMTKLQSVMNPEIKAIQEKYKGKNSDTVAMQKMQAETKAVYEKYGVSQWGSCVQLLIQMPILLHFTEYSSRYHFIFHRLRYFSLIYLDLMVLMVSHLFQDMLILLMRYTERLLTGAIQAQL